MRRPLVEIEAFFAEHLSDLGDDAHRDVFDGGNDDEQVEGE